MFTLLKAYGAQLINENGLLGPGPWPGTGPGLGPVTTATAAAAATMEEFLAGSMPLSHHTQGSNIPFGHLPSLRYVSFYSF